MDDRGIIQLLECRDERAITQISGLYGLYCRTIAHNILQDDRDAEECVSDTYLRAWNTIPPEKPRSLKLYLARIVRNLSLDRFREKNAQKRNSGFEEVLDEISEITAGSENVEERYLAKELEEAVNRFVTALPQRESGLFIRRYFYAESLDTVARRFSVTPHNAAVILSRVRAKLRAYLIKEGFLNE